MAKTEQFRRQHAEMQELAQQISTHIDRDLAGSESEVASLLSSLAGKLRAHLAMEDNALYPDLLANGDPTIRQKTQSYIDEMGGLKQAFVDYRNAWMTPQHIERDRAGFADQTRAVLAALGERIARENSDLYALVDAKG